MSIKHLFLLINCVHMILQIIWLVGPLVSGSHKGDFTCITAPAQPQTTDLLSLGFDCRELLSAVQPESYPQTSLLTDGQTLI